MKNYFSNFKAYIIKHKIISLIVVVVVGIVAYEIIQSSSSVTTTSYQTAKVTKGVIVSTVSGTGQVSASSQVDLKTKTSGDITYLNAKVGQEVYVGSLVASIDSGDAKYEYESAKISYDELVSIDPNDLRKAQDAVSDAKKDVETAYSDAEISISKTSTDLSDSLDIVDGLLGGYLSTSRMGLSNTERDYINNVEEKYSLTKKELSVFLKKYIGISDKSEHDTIVSLVAELEKISEDTLDVSKVTKETVVYFRDHEDDPAVALDAYTSVNTLVISVNSIVNNLLTANQTIVNSNRTLKDTEVTLADLTDGPDTINLRSQELTLKQKQEALADYSVTVPFAGVIASTADLNIGDTVSSGTTVVTLITKQKIAEISLNEIDAAKVKAGQKVALTFDAIENLNMKGTVALVNLIGTVLQGVVSYTVKISFDTQDDRVKSGMSVSASITTESKEDVLVVPNSAVKTQGGMSYVEVFDIPLAGSERGSGTVSDTLPRKQTVTIGTSNDSLTEILTGLKEDDSIVIKTTTSSASQSTTKSASSISSLLSGNRNATSANRAGAGFARPIGN